MMACLSLSAPLRSMYSPKARYIAPVSRYMAFSSAASALATLDLPAPAGPSMAMEKGLFCMTVLLIYYSPANSTMAWAKIFMPSISFSRSMYSSAMWHTSMSPGKHTPKATVLGIMRE